MSQLVILIVILIPGSGESTYQLLVNGSVMSTSYSARSHRNNPVKMTDHTNMTSLFYPGG